ncbi:hypothetical protein [Rubellicoccus peritrichatus]|uniref:Uncharacterized protein n=1 Tax=Rubellicoccus peritrichatus TaxID=3080537 RepID=A0AAQ3QUC4_9BACT|nr:hypothetical protein [Puniceicoccus sp. CR14]WOO39527.1 hypothetical protein RZN69_12960 [Puniceicoccus sp. CR14]
MSNLLSSQASNGLIGYIECDQTGEILKSEGDDIEALGSVLIYFQQIADLIGESLGFEPMEEARIIGRSTTTVCLAKNDSTLGVIFNSRAKIEEILPVVVED